MNRAYTHLAHITGKISIIMPAFNESAHILSNLREVVRTFESFSCDYEVLLVDDGSPDRTYLHAARVLVEHPERVRIVRYDENQGKGNALIAGFGYSTGDYIVFLDADMDLHPSQLPRFFQILDDQEADVVIGSKRHPDSQVDYPLIRRIYSWGYYSLVRLLFGLPLRDTQTGLKLFKRAVLEDVFPRVLAKRFAFDIEILSIAHSHGYKITDAPVRLEFMREMGRIKAKHVWVIWLDTLAIFYRLKVRRYYDRPMHSDVGARIEIGRELTLRELDAVADR